MWFLFGFLTLSICIVASYVARRSSEWKNQGGPRIDFEYKLKTQGEKVVGILFGISGVQDCRFTIKYETWYDKLFKKIGVSNEVQTGDDEFDRLVYVISDNREVNKALTLNSEIRQAVKNIFYFGSAYSVQVKKLECFNGRIWIEFTTSDKVNECNVKAVIADPLLPSLKKIVYELNQFKVLSYKPWIDAYFYKSLVVLGVSTGFAINALIVCSIVFLGDFPFLLSTSDTLKHSIYIGIFSILVLVFFSVVWLKNSSRTHLVLVELMSIGLLGVVGTAFHELRNINMEMDQDIPELKNAELIKAYTSKGRKYGTGYHLVFCDWNNSCSGRIRLKVSKSTYHFLSRYKFHNVYQHNGALGYKWVSSIQPVENSQTR